MYELYACAGKTKRLIYTIQPEDRAGEAIGVRAALRNVIFGV
jgi:hypothetical protein